MTHKISKKIVGYKVLSQEEKDAALQASNDEAGAKCRKHA